MSRKLKSRITIYALMALVITGLLSSCLRGGKIESITVTPGAAIIAAGATQQYTATATFSDGTTLNWTSAVTWVSSDPAITISNAVGSNGLATALNTSVSGTLITITATDTVNNVSSSATLSITATPLVSITVTPVEQVVSLSTPTTTYQAIGNYADGSSLNISPFVSWASSNTAVATIGSTVGPDEIVNIIAPGTTTITATDPVTHSFDSTALVVQQ